MIYEYERRINYYETDAMGIVHHSNYIRFLEEARLFFMDKIGLPYKHMEDEGIMIPVLAVQCDYKIPAKFNDIISITAKITEFTGVRMKVEYSITNKNTSELLVTAETKHCFTDCNLKPISLKKHHMNMYEIIQNCME